MRTRTAFYRMLVVLLLVVPMPVLAQGRGHGRDQKQQQAQNKGPQKKKDEKAPQKSDQRAQEKARPEQAQRADTRGRERVEDKQKHKANEITRPGKITARDDNTQRAVIVNRPGPNRFIREVRYDELQPDLRRFADSRKTTYVVAAGAVARAYSRGLPGNTLTIVNLGPDRVRIANRSGIALIEFSDRDASNLGGWVVDPWYGDLSSTAPAFCKSGAGHPVWGRQWCLEKGYGLGGYNDLSWGTSRATSDVVFLRPVTTGNLARDVLVNVLGSIVFDRLALHAITLGYTEPVYGVWATEPAGPSVLRLTSGGYPVAEIVDYDRDSRADLMLFALRPW